MSTTSKPYATQVQAVSAGGRYLVVESTDTSFVHEAGLYLEDRGA